LLSQGIAIN
jgi:hypothetical protein